MTDTIDTTDTRLPATSADDFQIIIGQ